MKQGVVFVVASAALVAAVVGAHVVAPLPDGAPFQGSAKAATASDTASAGPTPGVETSARPLVEVRQAPVPLLIRERPPAVLTTSAESAAAALPSPADDLEGASFARSAIEADGYKSVRNVVTGPDGTWRARAMRGNTEVVLRVDREGRVSAD
ncbi:MAG: hypothetical protein ACK4JB_25815 [Reyranella sp.]